MPTAPNLDDVKAYLGEDHSWTDDEIENALASEMVAQAHVVNVPADADYPDDLTTALCRRTVRALNMKANPLGYVFGVEGDASFISANDSEIKRLEAPYRKRRVVR
ncbi:phage gp6-like head-tail connector protein [Demequina oxidasica]|uniref:phage gp6-like head-tail connector protein n=1 Tax=Demequina oxidasica TaxID=676199 RepID=UPI00078503F6|nr:phage gp6-like head-tail connector protein [Demequina oxidasica]